MELAFPGHGPPDAPARLIERQRDYLLRLVSEVKELAAGAPQLTDAAKKELEARMTAFAPGAGLTFLISLSADAVARELHAAPSPSSRKEQAP